MDSLVRVVQPRLRLLKHLVQSPRRRLLALFARVESCAQLIDFIARRALRVLELYGQGLNLGVLFKDGALGDVQFVRRVPNARFETRARLLCLGAFSRDALLQLSQRLYRTLRFLSQRRILRILRVGGGFRLIHVASRGVELAHRVLHFVRESFDVFIRRRQFLIALAPTRLDRVKHGELRL